MTAWDDESVEEACDEAVPAGPELALLGPPTTPPPELVGPPPAVVAAAAAVAAMDETPEVTPVAMALKVEEVEVVMAPMPPPPIDDPVLVNMDSSGSAMMNSSFGNRFFYDKIDFLLL